MVTAAPGTPASGRLAGRVRALATWNNLWSAAFFVTLVLVRFTPPRAERSIKLDDSWQQAFTYFHSHGYQAGLDYVFTYGPLAYLEIGSFAEDQIWERVLAWQLGFGSLVALLVVALARRIPSRTGRGLFTLLCLLAAQVSESWWSLVLACVCVWLLDDAARSRARLALGLSVLATVSLVKYPYFVLAVLVVIAVATVWTRERGRSAALLVPAGFVALLVAAWLAAGQRLDGFPRYVATSNELTRGYAQAMHLPAPAYALVLACIAGASSLVWFGAWACANPRAPARLLFATVIAAATFLAYKSSFVLYDRDGAYFLFAGAAVLLPLTFRVHAPRWTSAWWPRAGSMLSGVSIACALLGAPSVLDGVDRWPRQELLDIGLRCADSLSCLTNLPAFEREQLHAAAENAELHALPRSKVLVGTRPIDFFGVHQALLLQAGYDYRPRPVFQTYAAFTPALMELNRSFYESERAPAFAAINLQPFPRHLPTMEDGLALQSLVRRYEPVLSERGVMLWQRRALPGPVEAARTVVLDRTLPVGEWLELGELAPACYVARIEVEPTLLGRLRELAYQPAPLFLDVRVGPRESHDFVFGSELAKAGWILDPLIASERDLARWAAGLRVARPRAIRIEADGSLYAGEARIVLERTDLWPKPPPDAARELAYPSFGTLPVSERVEAEAHTGWLYGHEVLVVGAPSELAFEVPPGNWRLSGAYGCEPAPPGLPSLGVDIKIALAKGATLLQRTLDPRGVPADRGMKRLDLAFQCEAPTRLLLQTLLRAPKAPPDAGYWSELRIEPATDPSDGAGG